MTKSLGILVLTLGAVGVALNGLEMRNKTAKILLLISTGCLYLFGLLVVSEIP